MHEITLRSGDIRMKSNGHATRRVNMNRMKLPVSIQNHNTLRGFIFPVEIVEIVFNEVR
jgi:hypothetical protein